MVGDWGRQNADLSIKKDKKDENEKIYLLIYCCNKNPETKKQSTQCILCTMSEFGVIFKVGGFKKGQKQC